MLKLFGSLLLTLSFFLFGVSLAAQNKTECTTLAALLRALRSLRDRLLWQRCPLDRFFGDCAEPELQKHGFSSLLLSAPDIRAGWKTAMLALPLPAEARSELLSLGETLGKTALAPQTEALSLCITTCERILLAREEQEKKRRKSTAAVWTLVGVLLSLLFL